MITDNTQLAAALDQMAYHADVLEGLRRYADETGDTALLPTTSGGHVVKLRALIAEARAYVETGEHGPDGREPVRGKNGFGVRAAGHETEIGVVEVDL